MIADATRQDLGAKPVRQYDQHELVSPHLDDGSVAEVVMPNRIRGGTIRG